MTPGKKQAVTLALLVFSAISFSSCEKFSQGSTKTTKSQQEESKFRERIAELEVKVTALEKENRALRGQLSTEKAQATSPARDSKGFSTNPKTAAAEKKVGKETRTYLVQSGDTLSSIALHFYKDKKRWTDIADANQNALSGSTTVRPGQTLIIP